LETSPQWEPGSAFAYHPVTYGIILGELVKRAADTTVGEFLRREVTEPLGVEFYIGFGASLDPRVAEFVIEAPIADIGSGHIGGTLGILLAKAGCEILYSSRHPDALKDLVKIAGPKACAGTVAEAIAFGDVIVLSVPLKAIPELDAEAKKALKGKIVIDTSNPYPERDGTIADEARKEPGGMGAFVARLLPGARIVRAFNTVYSEDLKRTTNNRGEKIGIPIAGDDQDGLRAVVELVERAGLDPVVVGGLSASKLFDVGTEVYATSAAAREIRKKLNIKPAGSKRAA